MCWSSLFAEQAENVHQLDHLCLSRLICNFCVLWTRKFWFTTCGPPCTPNLVLVQIWSYRLPCPLNLRRTAPFSRLASHTGLIKPAVSLFSFYVQNCDCTNGKLRDFSGETISSDAQQQKSAILLLLHLMRVPLATPSVYVVCNSDDGLYKERRAVETNPNPVRSCNDKHGGGLAALSIESSIGHSLPLCCDTVKVTVSAPCMW